jgi:hypothetical protein
MKFALALVVAPAPPAPAGPGGEKRATLPPVEDLSLPFWCDWGYDWDERCYWDDSDRLGLAGVGDKVWRAGLRFALDGLPPQAAIRAAKLSLWYDLTCVAPRRETRPCDGRRWTIEAHAIYTPRWQAEREVEFGPLVARAALDSSAAGWLIWDLTDLVADWHSGAIANNGVLLKLADGDESFDIGGPAFPSSSYADPAVRPRLTVWYARDCGGSYSPPCS